MLWLFSKIKSLLKWGAIGIGVLAAILIIVGSFIQEDSNQKASNPPKEQSVKEKELEEINPNTKEKSPSFSTSSNKNEKTESNEDDNSSGSEAQPVPYRIVESEKASHLPVSRSYLPPLQRTAGSCYPGRKHPVFPGGIKGYLQRVRWSAKSIMV